MKLNIDFIYPIGSIYMSVNNINPSTLFGGTWEQITSDAYLKIVTSGAGSTGGTSSSHKIPLTSIPSHNHSSAIGGAQAVNGGGAGWTKFVGTASPSTTGNAGGGQAYYPYYYGVYVWKRTA